MGMRNGILVLLLAPLLSCTATRLATLQSDFNDLYSAKITCEPNDGADTGLACEGQDVPLYQLALEAEASARKAKDPRSRIALLRLAGVAGWQGTGDNANELVERVSLEGVQRCDALEQRVRAKETWGAPRDCAILVLLPALLAHDVQLEKFAALEAAKQCVVGDVSYQDVVETYADSTVLFVHLKEGQALGYTGLSDSVREYVAESKRRMMCNFEKVRSKARTVCPGQSARAGAEKKRIEDVLGTSFVAEC
jgi:hypothetical protein